MRAPSERSQRWRRWLAPTIIFAVYAAASWLVLLPFGLLESSRMPVSASQDVGQQVWWLALALHELAHGGWSFFTSAIDHPSGVNLLDNGSMPLLGLLMAPITAAFGPVAAYVLLLRIGHLLSACSLCWVARRLGFGRLSACVAGLVYGFGPAMGPPTAQHAFLVFAPLPPLMLYLIYRELRPHGELTPHAEGCQDQTPPARSRPLRTGIWLGVLATVQYLVSSEILVLTLLVALCTAVIAALWNLARRRSPPFAAHAVGRLAAGAAASGLPLLAYPVGYMLFGRAHVSGPVQLTDQPGVPLLSILLPARTDGDAAGGQILGALWHSWSVGRGLWPNINLGYLGPLALIALATAVFRWRDLRVRAAFLFGVVALVIESGLPFHLIYRIPILQDVEPSRLALLVDLAAGVLLAAAVDSCVSAVRSRSDFRFGPVAGLLAASASAVSIAAALALAAPATGLTVHAVSPARNASRAIGRRIPPGAVVLTAPYPSFNHESAMLLQAQAGFGFDLLGGYAIRPSDRQRHATKTPLLDAPPAIANLLQHRRGDPLDPSAIAAELPAWLRSERVTAILVQPTDAESRTLANQARREFGRPESIQGWLLWLI